MAALLAFNRWARLALDEPSLSATFRMTLLAMVAFSMEGVRPRGRVAAVFLTVQSLVYKAPWRQEGQFVLPHSLVRAIVRGL